MVTKKEYKEALGRMCKAYFHLDESERAKKQFKEDLKLLSELVNEHFEEKQETNYEHFKDEIMQNIKYNLAVVNGEPKPCEDTNCDECDFKCSCCGEKRFKWLASPYKKPPYKLSQFEYDLIQTFDRCKECCLLNEIECLKKLTQKGYFKGINPFTKVHDIIDNCEVVG